MKRVIGRVLIVLLLVAAAGGLWVYRQLGTLRTDAVGDDVWMLSGLGSNVGVLRSTGGAAVVDTMTFRLQGDRIRERVAELTGGAVEVILNTHYHYDHTHGNPAFPAGLRIVATRRTLELMQALDGDTFSGAARETLPNESFTDRYELRLGDKTIRSFHVGRGHTDGDQVVLFVEDRVLHMGDLLFHHRYPNIDLEAGGSVREWPATLDRVLAMDGYDAVIPGHGDVTDRAGIEQFQRFLRELWAQVEPLARAGRSLEETRAEVRLGEDAGYEAIVIPGIVSLDRDFVVRRAWEEATGAVRKQVQDDESAALALRR
ncbi:MAG TPA: MBL fold metallo-hydrolase [Myxococcota bacterium]|nr:MBL fold metallo-hydrolase [Myxococcota bacterium]